MKRNVLHLIAVLFVVHGALIFYGCGRESAKSLTIAMSLGEEEWKVMRQDIFPPFQQKYDVIINAYQVESGQLATKLEALERSGKSEIDLFAQDNMNLAMLINKDLVLDLSAYRSLLSSQIMPNLIKACEFKEKLMFLPFRPNVQIVYYNADAFEANGLTPPQAWKELLSIGRYFKNKEGTGKILIKGFGGNATATQVYEFILQAGGDPYFFNDEGCVKAFEFLQRLKPYLSEDSKRAKWDTTNMILANRGAYIAQNWPFGVSVLIKKYKLDFIKTYSGWKGPAGERHVIGGDVFGLPKNSKNKKLALKFISYMQSKEAQEIMVSKLGWPSIREDAYARVEEWQRPHFESVKQALRNGVFRKQVEWWPAYEKYINTAFREIVFNKAPVKETLDKYKAKLEKEKRYIGD